MTFVRDKETGKIMDPERRVILQSRGGRSDGYKHWEINWNGEVIGFTAMDTPTYGGETKNIIMRVDWFVASMKIPENLKDRRSEVMGVIKEAMEAYGLSYLPLKVESHIQFDSRLNY